MTLHELECSMGSYDGPRVKLDSVSIENNIGVAVDKHVQNQGNEANKRVGLIRKHSSFWTKILYKVVDINSIKNVLSRASKVLTGLRYISHEDRIRCVEPTYLKTP
jgi:hypothetical protein